MNYQKIILGLLIIILLLSGCSMYITVHEQNVGIISCAILPITNETVDLDGPIILRKLFYEKLQQRKYLQHFRYNNYRPISLEQIDEVLKAEGITNAGQLSTLTPKKLGEKLGVTALIYSNLIEFKYVNVGFYKNRIVRASFKIIDTATEDVVWEKEEQVSNGDLTLSSKEAKKEFIEGLTDKFVEKIFHCPLKEETEELVERIIQNLPIYPEKYLIQDSK